MPLVEVEPQAMVRARDRRAGQSDNYLTQRQANELAHARHILRRLKLTDHWEYPVEEEDR
jgi:hypothetical protein